MDKIAYQSMPAHHDAWPSDMNDAFVINLPYLNKFASHLPYINKFCNSFNLRNTTELIVPMQG